VRGLVSMRVLGVEKRPVSPGGGAPTLSALREGRRGVTGCDAGLMLQVFLHGPEWQFKQWDLSAFGGKMVTRTRIHL
jgi:hypothetical protein